MKRVIQFQSRVRTSDEVAAQDTAFAEARDRWPRAKSIATLPVKGRAGQHGQTIVKVTVTLDPA